MDEKLPVRRKFFSPKNEKMNESRMEKAIEDADMLTDDFESKGESSLNINCNVVSVFPYEYDQVTKVGENEETDEIDMAKHKPVCYYVMNNGAIEEQDAFFEFPNKGMKNHLKPLYIQGKMENTGVNKILVNGGATMNLML